MKWPIRPNRPAAAISTRAAGLPKSAAAVEEPALRDMGNNHFVACHFAGELTLRGVLDTKDAA